MVVQHKVVEKHMIIGTFHFKTIYFSTSITDHDRSHIADPLDRSVDKDFMNNEALHGLLGVPMVVKSSPHSFTPHLDTSGMVVDHEASSSVNHTLPPKDDNQFDNAKMTVFDNDTLHSFQESKAVVVSNSHHIPSHVETDNFRAQGPSHSPTLWNHTFKTLMRYTLQP